MFELFSQINIYNKILLLITLVLLVLHIRAFISWHSTYNWSVSVCDPYLYPMVLQHSYLDSDNSYYPFKEVIPSHKKHPYPDEKKGIRVDWAESASNDWKDAQLPSKLHLSWYSIRENLHYKGVFDLPKKVIKKHFKKGYLDYWKERRLHNFQFVIGLAPEGKVVVWLSPLKSYLQYELATYTAAVDHDAKRDEKQNKIALAALKPEEHEAVLKAIETKEPIPQDHWQGTLRKQYTYRVVPQLSNGAVLSDELTIYQINGEVRNVNIADGKYHKAALPSKIEVTHIKPGAKDYEFYVAFHEEDWLMLFEPTPVDLPIDINFHYDGDGRNIEVYLSTETYEEKVKIIGLKLGRH